MRSLILSAALVFLLFAESAVAQALPSEQQRAVEAGLQPAIVFDMRPQAWRIEDRMARWKTPGVSIAVIDDGQIAWARGYGVLAIGEGAPVTANTRFQAASISKPVAAVAALSLVQDGLLTLDDDVNAVLKHWTFPVSAFTTARPLTLRDLLSHTGGTTVHGFPGYAQGTAIPTLVDILNGTAPANTSAVVSESAPGQTWKYSGGGYQIVQQMIEDATGHLFADVVAERVFAPSGMTDSGYDTPTVGTFAYGHSVGGISIPGGWNRYPEQAAAGLWTTPTDLARFALSLADALAGKVDGPLKPAMAMTMMTPVMGGYGLGTGITDEDEAMAFSHGGANEGFRAFWILHPRTGDGVVVMTNGDAGNNLAMEIVRSVAKTYVWLDYAPENRETFALSTDVLKARTGVWATEWNGERIAFDVRIDGNHLAIDTFRGSTLFTPITAEIMISGENGTTAIFDIGDDGHPILKVFGLELTKGQ